MAASIVNDWNVIINNDASTSAIVHTLGYTATPGNLLIFGGMLDKQTAVSIPGGSGWTSLIGVDNAAVSYFLWAKTAASETAVTVNLDDTVNCLAKTFVAEFSSDTVVDVVSNIYSGTAVRSITATTTATLGANPFRAYSFVGCDSVGGITAGDTRDFTNSYTALITNLTESSPTGAPALIIGAKSASFGSTETTTYSYLNGTTDEMAMMMLILRDSSGGGGSSPIKNATKGFGGGMQSLTGGMNS